jgi:competence protein ComEA
MYPPLRTQLLIAVAVAACVVAAFLLVKSRDHPAATGAAPGVRITPHGAKSDARGLAPQRTAVRRIMVDIVGEVRRPGVYLVDDGSRVLDVLHRAGGITRHADPGSLNRAAPVVDGQQLVVARRTAPTASTAPSEPGAGIGAAGAGGAGSGVAVTVSINSAGVAELDTLEGIGPVTAQRIVDDRTKHGPFARVEDLDRVPGIGAATIDAIRPRVQL